VRAVSAPGLAAPRATTDVPHGIARRGAKPAEEDFEHLRAEGIRLLRSLSGHVWTDHNLHDPGITILEQLCYALTDLLYRADFPVADHLTGPDGLIDFDTLALQAPHAVFPCRATTTADQRRWLLDRVDGLDDAMLIPRARANDEPDGLYRLVLELTQGGDLDDPRVAQARAEYRAQRNLCEDLCGDVEMVRDVACELHAEIEIRGTRDTADLLAEIYDRCANHIAQSVRLRSLREELADGRTLEQVYTGPAMRHGFIDQRDIDSNPHELLFVGELAEQIAAVDGVEELRTLALHVDGKCVVGSLPWHGDGWMLRLQVPGANGAALRGHVILTRRGLAVPVDAEDMQRRYSDLKIAARVRRAHMKATQDSDATAGLPQGRHHDLAHYLSVQEQFPAVYGLGERGLPATASSERRAQAKQLVAYLALCEQVMAHSAAQLQHLRDLFSSRAFPRKSYWWQVLGDPHAPGIESLYVGNRTPSEIEASVLAPWDPFADRKSRVLDHLLALYGETWGQNSVRRFLGYLDDDEADRLLLRNKEALLRLVASAGADRCGAFDDGRPSWDRTDNTSGLQRRLNLLLGFGHEHSRPLTRALVQMNRPLIEPRDPPPSLAADLGAEATVPSAARAPSSREQMVDDLRRIRPLQHRGLDAGLLRAGTRRDRYRLVPPASGDGCWRVLLLSDTSPKGWTLADADDKATAARIAHNLRRLLVHLNHESEGLHLVEHILLRPLGIEPRRIRVPPDFYALRLSVVLPDWTVRTRDPGFRRFVEETVRITCAAHLSARCVWLDFDRMRHFETRWQAWLQARIDHCTSPDASDEQAERLERAAHRVIKYLLGPPTPGAAAAAQRHA
jgi:hypothetical protein